MTTDSSTCVMSAWKNDMNYKSIIMFPKQNLAHKVSINMICALLITTLFIIFLNWTYRPMESFHTYELCSKTKYYSTDELC